MVPLGSAYMRYEPPSPEMLVGYLTWNGGKKSISWDPGASSESPAGPPGDAAANAQLRAAWLVYVETGRWPAEVKLPEPWVFESEPLPRTIHVNPAKNLEVDLALVGVTRSYDYDPCYARYDSAVITSVGAADPQLSVSLAAGERLMGGDVRGRYVYWYYTAGKARPPDPTGASVCHYRFHTEVDTLEKGSVIRLKVESLAQSLMFQFLMSGEGRSVVRIPIFSEEEWAYRNPDTAARSAGDEAPEGEADESVRAAFPFPYVAAPLALLAARRRRLPILVPFVLLAASLSGCLGQGAGAGEADPSSTKATGGLVESDLIKDEGNLTSEGNGSVLGTVRDDLGLPLANVHASLLGSNVFGTSDKTGRFQLHDVPPGAYTVRLDRAAYKSLEGPITVKSGFVSRVDFVMVPLQDKAADYRPHRHDYWLGEASHTIMSEPIVHTSCGVHGCYPKASIPPTGKTGPVTILPGTYDVEVTLDWDAAVPYTKFGLMVTHNADPGFFLSPTFFLANETYLFPREKNVPFHIRTSWEMSDKGHASASTWVFAAIPPAQPSTTDYNLKAQQGGFPIKMTVKIHRGVVPLEPEHPDAWMGGNRLAVTTNTYTTYHDPINAALAPYSAAYCLAYYPLLAPNTYCGPYTMYFGQSKGIIPFDATWLEIYLNLSREPTPSYRWDLRFWYAAIGGSNYDYAKYRPLPNPERTGLSTKYTLVLKPGVAEADPVYARTPGWYFVGVPNERNFAYVDSMHPAGDNVQGNMVVIAHRGTPPS